MFSDQVYEHLVQQLLSRQLRPGDVLDRKQIAEDLNVSLIPVSDAVQRLSLEGFLTTRRRKGTFVHAPSIEDLRGQFLLREAIECQSARLYCGDVIRAEKKRLAALARAVDRATSAGELNCAEDLAFHQSLVALTKCNALIEAFQRVVNLSLFYEVALVSPTQAASYDNHVALLNDLCAATPDQAAERIRKSNRMGKEMLLKGVPG